MSDRRQYGREPIAREALAAAVAQSAGVAGVLRALGMRCDTTGRRLVRRSLAEHGISTTHFTGQRHLSGAAAPNRKSAVEILVRRPTGADRTRTKMLRRALDDLGVPRVCTECGTGDTWQGRRLILEIDHVNGDRLDDRRENLRYLCPSCHSQTHTFGGRSGRAGAVRSEVE